MSDRDEPDAASGFSWGLTPGGSEPEPSAADPIPELVEPPRFAPRDEPEDTQPMAQVEPEPVPEPEPPTEPEHRSEPEPETTSGPEPSPEPSTALDALFGESNFQEYDESLIPADAGFAARPPAPRRRTPLLPARRTSPREKVMIGVVGGLVALLALTALFFLGTRLPDILPKPVAEVTRTPTPKATPTPTPTAKPVGPVAAGVHPWDALLGGECLDPYTGPWAETFTVVDCGTPHPAQMVFRGTFASAPTAAGTPAATSSATPTADPDAFPGPDALQQQISLLCAAPGVLDLAAAGQYTDAQVQGSYPVTAAEWEAGQRDYFCFVSRSSGQPLTGSVAAAK